MELLPNVYEWQRWPRGYEPTLSQLESMTEDEYEDYWDNYSREEMRLVLEELSVRFGSGPSADEVAKCKRNHPSVSKLPVGNL